MNRLLGVALAILAVGGQTPKPVPMPVPQPPDDGFNVEVQQDKPPVKPEPIYTGRENPTSASNIHFVSENEAQGFEIVIHPEDHGRKLYTLNMGKAWTCEWMDNSRPTRNAFNPNTPPTMLTVTCVKSDALPEAREEK